MEETSCSCKPGDAVRCEVCRARAADHERMMRRSEQRRAGILIRSASSSVCTCSKCGMEYLHIPERESTGVLFDSGMCSYCRDGGSPPMLGPPGILGPGLEGQNK